MLIVSLLLAGLAVAISTVALAVAVYHDMRDRDLRIRSSPSVSAALQHTAPPPLRLWEQPPPPAVHEAVSQAGPFQQLPDPDIIVGPWPVVTNASLAEDSPRRKSA